MSGIQNIGLSMYGQQRGHRLHDAIDIIAFFVWLLKKLLYLLFWQYMYCQLCCKTVHTNILYLWQYLHCQHIFSLHFDFNTVFYVYKEIID